MIMIDKHDYQSPDYIYKQLLDQLPQEVPDELLGEELVVVVELELVELLLEGAGDILLCQTDLEGGAAEVVDLAAVGGYQLDQIGVFQKLLSLVMFAHLAEVLTGLGLRMRDHHLHVEVHFVL